MKATLLFATMSMVLAMPCKSAQTDLESLRQRCEQQEQKIRHLENQLKQLGGERAIQSTPTAAGTESEKPAAKDSYTVKAGDTIEKIARRNGCTPTGLNKLNGLKASSIIHPGQKIKLPGGAHLAATGKPVQSPARVDAGTAKPAETTRIHKVKQGETYSSISRKYRVPVNTLIALNPGIKATALRPGLSIRLNHAKSAPTAKSDTSLASAEHKTKAQAPQRSTTPVIATQKPAAPAPAPAPKTREEEHLTASTEAISHPVAKTEAAAPQEATPETPKPSSLASTSSHAASSPPSTTAPAPSEPQPESTSKGERRIRSVRIEEPMTYGQFAAKHGTDAERLNDLNGLDLTQATVLAKGSELYVPAQP